MNINLIKTRESYTVKRLAENLKITPKTIYSWKKIGLKSIDNSIPLLFMGYEVKKFLSNRKEKNKVSLKPNEFYCVKCHKAVEPLKNTIYLNYTNKTIGKNNYQEIIIQAICPICGSKINRFSHSGKLKQSNNTKNLKENN